MAERHLYGECSVDGSRCRCRYLQMVIYLQYVNNNWVVVLLVAAVLQLYTTYRISSELEKEAKKL